MATNVSPSDNAAAAASQDQIVPTPTPAPHMHRWQKYFYRFWHLLILALSLALIVWISYDTFNRLPFLSNHKYMIFQFWTCVIFIIDFFIGLFQSDHKGRYFRHRWMFLLISIPYLNIINQYNIQFPGEVLYYLRFIPLLRGTYALALVMGYISENRAVSMLWQYTSILLALVYCMALIFYYEELNINPNVKTFWDALYWSAMNMTTVGCYFPAVTVAGKIISVILPIAGMLMLPLFTVYITDMVRKYNSFKSQF